MCKFNISTQDRNIIILSLGFAEADQFIKQIMFAHFALAKKIILTRDKNLWQTTVKRTVRHSKLNCLVVVRAKATISKDKSHEETFVMRGIAMELKDFKYKALSFTLNDYLNYELETHILRS